MYVPLRVHGHHSMLTGVDAPRTLLERARELGLPALALCDVDTLTGVVDFLLAARAVGGRAPDRRRGDLRSRADCPAASSRSSRARRVGRTCASSSARAIWARIRASRARSWRRRRRKRLEPSVLAECAAEHQEGLDLPGRSPAPARGARRARLGARAVRGDPSGGLRAPRRARRHGSAAQRARAPRTFGARRDGGVLGATRAATRSCSRRPRSPHPSAPVPARELVEAARARRASRRWRCRTCYCAPPPAAPTTACARDQAQRAARRPARRVHGARRRRTCMAPAEMRALYADLPERPGRSLRGEDGALARTLEVAERCTFTPPLGGIAVPDDRARSGRDGVLAARAPLAFAGASARYRPLQARGGAAPRLRARRRSSSSASRPTSCSSSRSPTSRASAAFRASAAARRRTAWSRTACG